MDFLLDIMAALLAVVIVSYIFSLPFYLCSKTLGDLARFIIAVISVAILIFHAFTSMLHRIFTFFKAIFCG